MKSIPAIILLLLSGISHASNNKECTVFFKNGDRIHVDSVSFNPDGSVSFTNAGVKRLIPSELFDFAQTPKPSEIAAADELLQKHQYPAAAKAFSLAADNPAHPDWTIYCLFNQADAIHKSGQASQALPILAKIAGTHVKGPDNELLAHARSALLRANILAASGKDQEAVALLPSLLSNHNDDLAAEAFNLHAEILFKQGKTREALLAYMRPTILFDRGVNARKTALSRICEILASMNDPREKTFADILNREYPEEIKVSTGN